MVPRSTGTAETIGQELAAWRAAHPRATLVEIEDVVLVAMEGLQARYLGDLAQARAAVDRAAAPADTWDERAAVRPAAVAWRRGGR